MNKKLFKAMWVMNMTPDSFSDGGHWQSHPDEWLSILRKYSPLKVIIDVGAESTAPSRNAISSIEEIKRLDEIFFSKLDQLKLPLHLSIDTYKLETIKWCLDKLKNYPNVEKIYWNDVSGQYLDGVSDILTSEPKLFYVLCHNRVKNRADVLQHTKYQGSSSKRDFFIELSTFFQHALEHFKSKKVENRIILDPAFGFAKSRQENWNLIEKLPELIPSFANQHFLIGISRKSFLRDVDKKYQDIDQAQKSLTNEAIILGQLLQQLKLTVTLSFKQNIIWRTHHDSIIEFLRS